MDPPLVLWTLKQTRTSVGHMTCRSAPSLNAKLWIPLMFVCRSIFVKQNKETGGHWMGVDVGTTTAALRSVHVLVLMFSGLALVQRHHAVAR